MPNIEALEKVYDTIYVRQDDNSKDSQGRYWDQSTWRDYDECGTAMCFAGWAIELDPGYSFNSHYVNGDILDYVDVTDPEGFVLTVQQAAREILGLTPEQGTELFLGTNEIEDIRAIIDSWKD